MIIDGYRFVRGSGIRRLLLLLVIGLLNVESWAEGVSEGSLPELVGLNEIPQVYSASRVTQPILESPSAIIVLSGEELRQTGATNLPDALRSVPGLEIAKETGFNTDIGARGIATQYSTSMLVMLDGRPIYSDHTAGVNWKRESVIMSNIDRVEIVLSPGSAVYGANAFAGVVNVITKSPWKQPLLEMITGAGNHRQKTDTLTSAYSKENFAIEFIADHEQFNGYGSEQAAPFRDDYQTNKFLGRFDLKPDRQSHLMYQAGYNWTHEDFPGSFLPSPDTRGSGIRRIFHHLLYDRGLPGGPNFSLRLYRNEREENWIDASADPFGNTEESRDEGQFESTLPFPHGHALTFGSEIWGSRSRSLSYNQRRFTQNGYGFYLQDQWKITPPLILTPGARVDYHNSYGSQVSPRISLVYLIQKNSSIRFAFNKAYQNPSYVALHTNYFNPGPPYPTLALGDPNLKPQEISSYEMGYQLALQKSAWFRWNYYHHIVTGRLAVVPDLTAIPPTFFIKRLTDKQITDGTELSFDKQWIPWFLTRTNVSYENSYVSETHDRPDNIPMFKGNLGFTAGPQHGWSSTWSWHLVGKRYVDGFGVQPGYGTVDAQISKSVQGDLIEFSLSAQNLFNNKHFEFPNFGFIDRTYMGKIRVRL